MSGLSFAFIIAGLRRPTDRVVDDLVTVNDVEDLATIRIFIPPTSIRFPLNYTAPIDAPKSLDVT